MQLRLLKGNQEKTVEPIARVIGVQTGMGMAFYIHEADTEFPLGRRQEHSNPEQHSATV